MKSETMKSETMRASGKLPAESRRGASLSLVLVVFAIVLLTLAAALVSSTSAGVAARRELEHVGARALAEGAIEIARAELERRLRAGESAEGEGVASFGTHLVTYRIRSLGSRTTPRGDDGWRGDVEHVVLEASAELAESSARCQLVLRVTRSSALSFALLSVPPARLALPSRSALRGRVLCGDDLLVANGADLLVDSESLRSLGEISPLETVNAPTRVLVRIRERETFLPLSTESLGASRTSPSRDDDPWRGAVTDARSASGRIVLDGVAVASERSRVVSGAGLRIVDEQAFDQDGRKLRLPPGTLRATSVWNSRSGREERLLDLDIRCLSRSPHVPANGIIAFERGASDRALRIVRAEALPRSLTFVTSGALWVKGDFNRRTRHLALLAADSVHLLSAGWDDTKTRGALPAASSTYVCASVVSGFEPTRDEFSPAARIPFDVVRLHEDWSAAALELEGALVVSSESASAASHASLDDVFRPPHFVWRFDRRWLSAIPPATPTAWVLERIFWDDGLALPRGP